MQVTEIWRYPVKSMGGEQLKSATVTEFGLEYDRAWGVFDPETDTVFTGRRAPKLLLGRAEVVDGELQIYTERGAVIAGTKSVISDALSAWLGQRVELRRAGEEGGTYEAPRDSLAETQTDWVRWTGPGGAWHDSTRTRVSLLSKSTTHGIDVRRFRANLITDGEDSAEDDWYEETIAVGDEVILDVRKQIDRCVMVSRPSGKLAADLDALKWVVRERHNLMGVGCLVEQAGRIAVGDEVRATSGSVGL